MPLKIPLTIITKIRKRIKGSTSSQYLPRVFLFDDKMKKMQNPINRARSEKEICESVLTEAKNIKFPQLNAADVKLYKKIIRKNIFEINGGKISAVISKKLFSPLFLKIKRYRSIRKTNNTNAGIYVRYPNF